MMMRLLPDVMSVQCNTTLVETLGIGPEGKATEEGSSCETTSEIHQPLLLSSAKRRLRSSSAFTVADSLTGTAAIPA